MKHNVRTYIIDIENTNHPNALIDLDICDGQLVFNLFQKTREWILGPEIDFGAQITCQKCGHIDIMDMIELEDFLNGTSI